MRLGECPSEEELEEAPVVLDPVVAVVLIPAFVDRQDRVERFRTFDKRRAER